MPDEDYQPVYKWRATWPDDIDPHTGQPKEDFSGFDEGGYVGRIYRMQHGPKEGQWRWAGSTPKGFKGAPHRPNTGFENTPREAARQVEDYWRTILRATKRA